MDLQTLNTRKSMLARMAVNIIDKQTPLTSHDRQRLHQIKSEVDQIEPQLGTEEQRFGRAFRSWLRCGYGANAKERGITSDEQRALSEYRDLVTGGQAAYPGATAGFFVPMDFYDSVQSMEKYYGPMLDYDVSSIVDSATGAPLPFPADSDATISGEQVAEEGQVTDVDVPISDVVLKSYKFSSRLVKVSIELLQDSGFPLDLYLAGRFAIRLARVINPLLTTGTGTGQPTGFVTAALAEGSTVAAAGTSSNDGSGASTNTIGFDDLTELEQALDPAYRTNAAYMAHSNTFAALKRVKDKMGRPIWTDFSNLNGYPYLVNNGMDQLQSQAGSPPVTRNTVAFGNFKKYFVRRTPLFVQRLGQRFADFGQVAFLAMQRVDGNLIDAGGGAIKLLTNTY